MATIYKPEPKRKLDTSEFKTLDKINRQRNLLSARTRPRLLPPDDVRLGKLPLPSTDKVSVSVSVPDEIKKYVRDSTIDIMVLPKPDTAKEGLKQRLTVNEDITTYIDSYTDTISLPSWLDLPTYKFIAAYAKEYIKD